MTYNEIYSLLNLFTQGRAPFVLATLVTVKGSSYRRAGARLLMDSGGNHAGSISGGCLEDDVKEQARRVQADGQARVIVYDTTGENDLVWGVGLGCHGVATLFIERLATRPAWADELNARLRLRRPTSLATVWGPAGTQPLGTLLADEVPSGVDPAFLFLETVRPPLQLLICGAGDDAQALARLSHGLGWSVLVSDPRPAYCTAERFPHASACLVGPPGEVVQTAALDAHSAAVVMSHHYLHDVPFVRALLGSPVTYLGLLGPRKRAVKIAETLAEDTGLPVDDILERLHAPVGLDLGADGPEQVALSILAEIQAGLGKRDGRPLRERKAPIHEA